jgi:stage III sporulation protein SpoIIIAA
LINNSNDLESLIKILPKKVISALNDNNLKDITEIVLDLGRKPEIRQAFRGITQLDVEEVTYKDIDYVIDKIPPFTSDNRSGISGTLHRISAIRNRRGRIIGLTCRVGRAIEGTVDCITKYINSGKSILFLGKPGVGKTTKLREIARILADDFNRRVVVVDTSNEIGGDGDYPHSAIGHARRMQVSQPEFQKDIMIEAVQNHTPEVIIVDEIGTEEETQAARTIAERGVTLIGTAHGNELMNLIKNPTLSDLVGNIESVTLGDEEAHKRGTQKTILERAKKPTFDIIIEIRDRNTMAIYNNTEEAVDYMLRGWLIQPEIIRTDGNLLSPYKATAPIEPKADAKNKKQKKKKA